MKIALLILILLFIPVGVWAQQQNFIPCGFDLNGDKVVSGVAEECDFEDLLKLVDNILNWLVIMAFPLSVIALSYAGFILLTTGISDRRSKARDMLIKVLIGFAIILAARLIVYTIVNVLLDTTAVGIDLNP